MPRPSQTVPGCDPPACLRNGRLSEVYSEPEIGHLGKLIAKMVSNLVIVGRISKIKRAPAADPVLLPAPPSQVESNLETIVPVVPLSPLLSSTDGMPGKIIPGVEMREGGLFSGQTWTDRNLPRYL